MSAKNMRDMAVQVCHDEAERNMRYCNDQSNSEEVRAASWAKATACGHLAFMIGKLPLPTPPETTA